MIRPVGIETEYGLNCEGFQELIDFGYEASMVVRAAPVEAAFRGWDYTREDPRLDLRGTRINQLAHDPDGLCESTVKSSKMSRAELLANTVLPNGARYYNDHNHPEYCTETCTSLQELVAQDKAGELLLWKCQQARNEALQTGHISIVKNNTDYHGRSYGTHENYLVPRNIAFQQLVDGMMPFLTARQVLIGAGKVGCEGPTPGDAEFQLSQRADFFEEQVGINTTARRPIFNTRDEPHADRKRWRRLHVIAGDANRSEYATALKVGMTGMVIDALVTGQQFAVDLRDPLRAIKEFSRDPNLTVTTETVSNQEVTALDVMEIYLETLEKNYQDEPDKKWIMQQWRELVDLLRQNREKAGDRLDWVAKWNLMEELGGSGCLDLSSRKKIDLAYHLIDPELSLFDSLVAAGQIRRLVNNTAIRWASNNPPSGTRGSVRGLILQRFEKHVINMEWDSITLAADGHNYEITLAEIEGDTIDRLHRIFTEAPNMQSALTALNMGEH